jgi:hypothetical protein
VGGPVPRTVGRGVGRVRNPVGIVPGQGLDIVVEDGRGETRPDRSPLLVVFETRIEVGRFVVDGFGELDGVAEAQGGSEFRSFPRC